jgi:hypothetical protein
MRVATPFIVGNFHPDTLPACPAHGSDRAKEQRFDPADLFVKFMERLAIPPKNT